MQYVTMRLGHLPILMALADTGEIAFQPAIHFNTLIDQPEDGVQAIFDMDGFTVGADTEIEYGVFYEYKQMPELLYWLKTLKLEEPNLTT